MLIWEDDFGVDANGDGEIGLLPIERVGNTAFLRNSSNRYVARTGGATYLVGWDGEQIYPGIYPGWEPIAAENVGGENQILWKNVTGNDIQIWRCDANWNRVEGIGNYDLDKSQQMLFWEDDFGVDANGDGEIGYLAVESEGNTKLLIDGNNFYSARTDGGIVYPIRWDGQTIFPDIYPNWEALAAESLGGVNLVLWRSLADSQVQTWGCDSSWNRVGAIGNYGLTSPEAILWEFQFQVDIDGNGTIGLPSRP
jgi:hypothetical protein